MRKNLRRWMLELAVTSGLAPEIGRQYADIDGLKRDAAMLVLRQPAEHDDDAVFEALCAAGGSRIPSSAIFKKDENQGKRLFSAVWRHAAASVEKDGKDFFTACFGTQKEFNWHPLGNAVYWNRRPTANADYILNKCHRFICRNGIWKERSYRSLYYNRPLFEGLLRETDRLSRMYLKTGHPLKERQEDAWASPIVEDVIAQAQKAKIEAAQQKIAIRFENLHLIRRAALQTRESLLTEEEKAAETKGAPPITEAATGDAPHDGILSVPLTAEQVQVLTMLLNGESVRKTLQSWNEMAEVFADSLNEALFNEIGDTAVACDGVDILLVEDYREDMIRILGGTKR